jgi:outer membrane lipoprotein SlyB
MKKIMTLVIVVSLLFSSGVLFAQERQGVQLEITKTDGTKINGELIGVKKDSTLILESSSRIGASIDLSDIKVIKIVKGSNTGTGILLGLLAGGAMGAFIGYGIIGSNERRSFDNPMLPGDYGVIIGGLAGAFLGGAIGSSTNKYETFQIEGKPQGEIKAFLEKLRTRARFPDYQ